MAFNTRQHINALHSDVDHGNTDQHGHHSPQRRTEDIVACGAVFLLVGVLGIKANFDPLHICLLCGIGAVNAFLFSIDTFLQTL